MFRTSFNRSGLKSSNCVSSFVSVKYCRSKFAAFLFAFSVLVEIITSVATEALPHFQYGRWMRRNYAHDIPREMASYTR